MSTDFIINFMAGGVSGAVAKTVSSSGIVIFDVAAEQYLTVNSHPNHRPLLPLSVSSF